MCSLSFVRWHLFLFSDNMTFELFWVWFITPSWHRFVNWIVNYLIDCWIRSTLLYIYLFFYLFLFHENIKHTKWHMRHKMKERFIHILSVFFNWKIVVQEVYAGTEWKPQNNDGINLFLCSLVNLLSSLNCMCLCGLVLCAGGCGAMYEIHIESAEFKGKRTVQQHQLVNQVTIWLLNIYTCHREVLDIALTK